MKKLLFISMMFCIVLASCSDVNNVPTVVPSVSPEPSATATLTPTKIRPTRTFAPTPTLTPLPAYQNKQVIFEYNVTGNHSDYDFFFEDSPSWSKLVLYSDGQMIIPGKTYMQEMLSPVEMKQFISKLEALGFYSIESNQQHDTSDKLYKYGNNFEESYDGLLDCIVVNAEKSRELCIYEPAMEYLVPKMKNILRFLDTYEPKGTTPYSPDRLLVSIQSGRDPYNDNLPKDAVPWPDNLPSLDTFKSITYVDGEIAREIYNLFDDTNAGKVFTQSGKEYTMYFYVVLPHEKLSNAYQ
ncbi:MAG TPA: hypothetical protein VIR02_04695 [Anaerolineales bacterium]